MTQGHNIANILTGRKGGTFDASLELRNTAAAAITAVNGSYASPSWASSVIDLKVGAFYGRVGFYGPFAPTIFNNDNYIHFALRGINQAETKRVILAEIRIGKTTTTWGGDGTPGTDFDFGDLSLYFCTTHLGYNWPKVQLINFNGGTGTSFTTGAFGANIYRID